MLTKVSPALKKLFASCALEREEAKQICELLLGLDLSATHKAAILGALAITPLTTQALLGFRDALFERAHPMAQLPGVDMCGTGGDGKDTFNISTTASFVVAGVGVPVCKHGNVSASSMCGSSQVIEALGITLTNDIARLEACFHSFGFAYLHAPLFHSALKEIAPLRKELGFRTLFNLLGPLCNPAKPTHQLIGVSDPAVISIFAEVCEELGITASVVHSIDGYDEISLTGDFLLHLVGNKNNGSQQLSPQDIKMPLIAPEALSAPGAGTPDENAALIRDILSGLGTEAQNHIVIANAGAAVAMYCGRPLIEGLAKARTALESGAALQVLNDVANFWNCNHE